MYPGRALDCNGVLSFPRMSPYGPLCDRWRSAAICPELDEQQKLLDRLEAPNLWYRATDRHLRAAASILTFFGEHRSVVMFGVLVVVLCRDRVAILRFSTGQRQIALIASLQVLKAIWLGSGRGRYPVLWPSCKRARWRS